MIYKASKWPIFIFHLQIWKLQISTDLFTDKAEMMIFEYVGFYIYWDRKTIFKCKLYNTWERMAK